MSSSGMKISPCISFQVFPMDPFTGGFGCVKEAWSLSGICGGSGLAVRHFLSCVLTPGIPHRSGSLGFLHKLGRFFCKVLSPPLLLPLQFQAFS